MDSSSTRNSVRLLIATTNRDKLREIRALLAHLPVDLIGLPDVPSTPEPEEEGATFQENARLKARYYDAAIAVPRTYTVAEDSGLAIDALGGAPGIHSARFLRPEASYAERFEELHRRLAGHPRPWTARFVCAVAVAQAGSVVYETTGTIDGEIAPAARGNAGFGYDPIFYYPPYGRTLGEVQQQEKLAVAHRGAAFRKLAAWLEGT